MKRGVLILIALGALAGCGPEPARPGDPETYARLGASTSCPDLQSELDSFLRVAAASTAGSERATVAVAYAKAAEERRQALQCDGSRP